MVSQHPRTSRIGLELGLDPGGLTCVCRAKVQTVKHRTVVSGLVSYLQKLRPVSDQDKETPLATVSGLETTRFPDKNRDPCQTVGLKTIPFPNKNCEKHIPIRAAHSQYTTASRPRVCRLPPPTLYQEVSLTIYIPSWGGCRQMWDSWILLSAWVRQSSTLYWTLISVQLNGTRCRSVLGRSKNVLGRRLAGGWCVEGPGAAPLYSLPRPAPPPWRGLSSQPNTAFCSWLAPVPNRSSEAPWLEQGV